MSKAKEIDELLQLKEDTINKMLVIVSLLAILPQIFALVRSLEYGITILVALDLFNTSIIWGLTIYRKRLNIQFKIIGLIAVIFIGVSLGFISVGLIGPMKYFVVILPVFLSFVLNFRQSLITFFSYILIYCVFAWLYISGFLTPSIDISTYSNSLLAWIIDALVLTTAAIGVFYVGNNYNISLLDFNKKIKTQNTELEDKEKRFRTLFNEAADAILLLDKNGFIFDCNQATCDLYKFTKSELSEKTPVDLSPEFQPGNKKTDE